MLNDETNQNLDFVTLVSRKRNECKPDSEGISNPHAIAMFLFLAILAALSIFG